MELGIVERRRAASIYFRAVPLLFVTRRLFVLWGKRSCCQSISNKQQQSEPNIVAVTVTVVELAVRCTSFLQPAPGSSAQLLTLQTSHRVHEPQSTCILPGVALL